MPLAREDLLGLDRFAIKEQIGAGAMGEVYKAYDRERCIDVALKMLRDPEPQRIYRFKREFRALADVAHPHLVRLYELVSWGERWFFTMELVDGVDFLTWVRRGPEAWTPRATPAPVDAKPTPWATEAQEVETVTAMEPAQVPATEPCAPALPPLASRAAHPLGADDQWQRLRSGLRQLAVGVQALHDHGTLHRDIKPSNVMVTRDNRVVLLDFGIISELRRPAAEESSGLIFGTPAYMAPEVGTRRLVGESSDWYAVGIMMYEAVTGRRPFHGSSAEVMETKRLRDATPVRELGTGTEVPGDLERLCTELVARDPEQRPTGSEVLGRLGARRTGPIGAPSQVAADSLLIGRERHLGVLRAAYAATLAGEPRVVLVSGPSGVGKSTLVSHFLGGVGGDAAALVITGRCYERESVPFKAVDDLVDDLCQRLAVLPEHEVLGLLPRAVGALARLFPVLEQIDAVKHAPRRLLEPTDPHEQRRVGFAALRELLLRLSARRPLVLHIDDAQWGDVDSAALLAEVFRPPFAPPALLVVSYREDTDAGAGPFVAHFRGAEREHVELSVDELGHDDARAVAAQLLAVAGAPPHFAETIARESGGNPFFVSELVRHVARGADADRAVSLEDIVRVRVAELALPARRLLALLAVAAWPVPRGLALAAAGVELDGAAAEASLLHATLINVLPGRGGDTLETFHDRVRAMVVAGLAADEVLDLHRRLAGAIEAGAPGLVDHLAEHLELAGETDRAGACYQRAADDAGAKLAFERAGRLYARALELLAPGGSERAELNARMAYAFQNAGKGAESAAGYLVAAGGVGAVQGLRYRGLAAQQLLRAGLIEEGVATMRDVLSEVGFRLPRARWRTLLALLRHRLQVRLRGLHFRERTAEQVTVEQLTKIDVCWTASVALGMCDTPAGALFQARHLLEALRTGEPHHVSHALGIEAVYRSLAGPRARDDVDRITERARDMADSVDDPLTVAWAHGAYALTRYQLGWWRRACEAAETSLAQMRGKAGMWFERATVEMYRLWALYWLGRFRELTDHASSLYAEAQDIGDRYSATNLSIGLPAIQWLVRGRPEEGRRAADEAMKLWPHRSYHLQHHWHTYAVAHVELYRGDGRAAWERLRAAWSPLRAALLTQVQMVRFEALWARGRAAVAAAVDAGKSPSEQRGLLRDALWAARRLRRERRVDADACALAIEAGVAHLRGDAETAFRRLTTAGDRAQEADMFFHAAAVQLARGRLLGGDRGAQLVADAETWMSDQSIADPTAMLRVFLPGIG